MPIHTIEPNRLYRQIADQIRQAVAAGDFEVGLRLPAERDLAKQLGVSRPSLREALIALEVEGLIEVRTGSGIYVRRKGGPPPRSPVSTEWSPMQMMQAREVLEAEVAALAARHAKKTDLQNIEDAMQQMRAQAAAGQSPREGDEAFHNAIAQACANEVLANTVREYEQARYAPIFTRLGGYFETRSSWNSAIKEHVAVHEAIRARDPDAARLAMQLHLQKARKRYTASWNLAQGKKT